MGRREPTAAARSLARVVRDNYDALRAEGFSPREALTYLAVWAANVPPPPADDDQGQR